MNVNILIFCDLFEGECPILPGSALTGRGLDLLKRRLFERLDVIRVYAKPPGQEPDLERPFVLKKGSAVIDLARKVHRDYYENLKIARVWGSSAFDGQKVPRDYELQDGDIVGLRIKTSLIRSLPPLADFGRSHKNRGGVTEPGDWSRRTPDGGQFPANTRIFAGFVPAAGMKSKFS